MDLKKQESSEGALPPPPKDFETRFQQFKQLVEQEIRKSWEAEDEKIHLQQLAAGIRNISPVLLSLGELAKSAIAQNDSNFKPWFVHYEWMEQAKSFLVLWRNILFQEQKAWLQVSTGNSTTTQFQKLKKASKETLTDAAFVLLGDLDSTGSHPLNSDKQLKKWRLQDNPWLSYKEQITQLPKQCEELLHQSETLWNASGVFTLIRSHFVESYDGWIQGIKVLKKGLNELLVELATQDSIDNTIVGQKLEQLNEEWLQQDGMEVFHNKLDDYLSKLPKKEKISVGTNGGLLLYKTVDLQEDARVWLESELISEIYDLNTIKDGISNKINLSINHIENRLASDKESEEPSGKAAIVQILANFLKSLDKSEEKTEALKIQEEEKLSKYFVLTKIYDEAFLPRSLQYTISQYRESARWSEIKNWVKDKGARINQLQRNVLAEEALSISERIVRIVNERKPQVENNHYTNMFLTHGWIGDSFVVGRKAELNRVKDIVENWRLGFRGAVMLTGNRFCGKTLFGEMLDQRFFKNQAIKLQPNNRLMLSGRRQMNTGYELKPLLQFINKNSKGKEIMIWIDDLENWSDAKTTLSQNVNDLLRFIDANASRLFFVVSMSNWLKAHLAQAFEIEKVFQSEINLGPLSSTEIKEAVLVRHSATHNEMIDSKGQEVTNTQLSRSINRIYQLSEGNVGEALHRWAYTIERYDDERILLKDISLHVLPSFLSTDSALLLKTVLMEKKTTRKLLRKFFGPAFTKHYEVVMKRMLNLGILQEEQGRLEVNPYLVNDIGKQLAKKVDFRYHFDPHPKEQITL